MNVAILGATGAVGREMMKILAERSFPVEELRLLASPRSAGQKLLWQGRELTVQPAEDSAFEGMDIVLGAAENDIAKRFAPAIVKAGAVFVDNSSAFRMDSNVPLVIPEINPEDVRRHKGIIANPNCTTIVSLVAINALNQDSPIQSIIASSYQAVSGAGAGGPGNRKSFHADGIAHNVKLFRFFVVPDITSVAEILSPDPFFSFWRTVSFRVRWNKDHSARATVRKVYDVNKRVRFWRIVFVRSKRKVRRNRVVAVFVNHLGRSFCVINI